MQRKNREINVFSLSAMDLFASAMGAFMLICLIALPSYLKASEQRQQLAELAEQNQAARDSLAESQAEIEREQRRQQQRQERIRQSQEQSRRQQQQLEGMRRDLANAAIIILAKWDTSEDIDLYVVSPKGHEYGAEKHNRTPPGNPNAPRPHYPDENAELSMDANGNNATLATAVGTAGIEVWTAIRTGTGEYKIYLQRCEPYEPGSTKVQITVIHEDKYLYKTIEEVRLTGYHNDRPPNYSAVLAIDAEGNATLR